MKKKTPRIRAVVFAAGKSTRMGTGRSKMLETVERDGQAKETKKQKRGQARMPLR